MFGCTRKNGERVLMRLPNGESILLIVRVVQDWQDPVNPQKVAVRIKAPRNVKCLRAELEEYKQFGPADCIVKPQATSKLPGD